ncbi:hypothetical protein [Nocardioides caldifontis]|uniref:hypothetical protein n=1 Tax=Nocardioides caldifontis TaxID=2588938 RepID=UPI0011DF600E|nr:hypothetical protein [Nocardioides caldifontis]
MVEGIAGTRPVSVHIGASKTGTSSLQRGLWQSVEQLGAAGIGIPLPGRVPHVRRLLRPLGWVTGSGFVLPLDTEKLDALERRLTNTGGARLLISNEDLCEAGPDQIEALAGVLRRARLDPEVVLTVRNLASVLPSEWQQFLKHRLTTPYPAFLEEVRDRRGDAAAHFWTRQDYVAIAERWTRLCAPERFHVVVVPPMAEDPDAVFRFFAEAVGFPQSALRLPRGDVNASLGYVEAEVYRRLNIALGSRLAEFEKEYQPAIRRVLLKGVLARKASGRITLPPEHVDWVRAEADRQRKGLLAGGYTVHGNPDALVPPADVAKPLPEVTEQQVADAAVATLANFAVRTFEAGQTESGEEEPPPVG